MQNIDKRKEELEQLLLELNNSVVRNEARYFHVKTLDNLIFPYDQIKSENDKIWVFETLKDFFTECFETEVSIDRNRSEDLYMNYLDKVCNYYSNNLGFVVLLNRNLIYMIYAVVLIACVIFFKFYVVLLVASLFCIAIAKTFTKYRKKQVYNLFW